MILTLNQINKSFGNKDVLKGVSFQVESGKACGLLGRNGAGKTTSIRILMNVFPADSGEILFDGKPIDYEKVSFGYLPEERGLYPKKEVLEQLVYFAMLKGMRKKEATGEVDYWLERLDMMEYRNKKLDTLSKGNQQKIQLVTAVAHNPDVVILDEPFSGLDPVNSRLLKEVVKEIIGKGKIVLFSSHQMSYVEEFCDHIAIMNGGKIVLDGDLDEIKRNYVRDRLVVKSNQNEKIMADFGESCQPMSDNYLLIQLDSPEDKKRVMKELAENYELDELKVFEPSLNDIFVEYASQQI